jgi:menaquinol-cytochrome c reductase cytochrome b subunit
MGDTAGRLSRHRIVTLSGALADCRVTDFDAMSSNSVSPPASVVTALARARVVVLAIVSMQFLVLLVSGAILFFAYRPSGTAAYGELLGDDVRSSIDLARATRVAHEVAARSVMPTAVVAGVLVAIRERASARYRVGRFVGASLVLLVAAGLFTGYLLPWDQLGLRAVSVGTDMRGYVPLFDDDEVRFVLIGGAEVGPGTVVRWLLFHMLVVGCVLSALLVVAWRRGTHQHGLTPPPRQVAQDRRNR